MYAVTIAFGSMAWRLLYKDEEKAKEAFNLIQSPGDTTTQFSPNTSIHLTDDFGQKAFFRCSEIGGAMLEDMDASKVASIEMALHNARTQASAEQRAAADQTLSAARANNRRGPPIVTPGFN